MNNFKEHVELFRKNLILRMTKFSDGKCNFDLSLALRDIKTAPSDALIWMHNLVESIEMKKTGCPVCSNKRCSCV